MPFHHIFCLRKFFSRPEKYDYIFSLGDGCFGANALQLAGLRKFAGPFDLLCGLDLNKCVKLLLNNFNNFAPNVNWCAEYDKNPESYDVRIKRIIDCLTSGRRVLLVHAGNTATLADARRALDSLQAKFGNNIHMILVLFGPDIKKCKLYRINPDLYYVRTLSWDKLDDCDYKKSIRMFIRALAGIGLSNAS